MSIIFKPGPNDSTLVDANVGETWTHMDCYIPQVLWIQEVPVLCFEPCVIVQLRAVPPLVHCIEWQFWFSKNWGYHGVPPVILHFKFGLSIHKPSIFWDPPNSQTDGSGRHVTFFKASRKVSLEIAKHVLSSATRKYFWIWGWVIDYYLWLPIFLIFTNIITNSLYILPIFYYDLILLIIYYLCSIMIYEY